MSKNKTPTPFITSIANQILTHLKNTKDGMDNICASDFNNIDRETFGAKLNRMYNAGLIVDPKKNPNNMGSSVFEIGNTLENSGQKISVAITDIGKKWLIDNQSSE